jgi:hypothetical protein
MSSDDKSFDRQTFQQAIECLTYMSVTTKPDIAAAVGVLSQYMSKPSQEHWMGVKRVLRYLKGTIYYGIKYSSDKKDKDLVEFSDSDWAGDIDTRRSTSGMCSKSVMVQLVGRVESKQPWQDHTQKQRMLL